MMTGKNKEQFEEWYTTRMNGDKDYYWLTGFGKIPVGHFYDLPLSMQWGVYLEYFDSLGLEISTLPVFRDKCNYDSFKCDGHTFTILFAEECQYLTWADFNQCAEDRDEEEKECEPNERCLEPSFKTRKEAQEAALKKADEIINERLNDATE